MGDFFIDFRPQESRRLAEAAEFLRFFDDVQVDVLDCPEFGLVLTSPDERALWGPGWSADGSVFAGVCGRIALDQHEWDQAQQEAGEGGLACRHILKCYREGGIQEVCELSGHFVVLLFDRRERTFFIVTDRWGIAPAFRHDTGGQLVLSSHPDALADAVGESRNWDLTSFAEFILTCKLSYPFTYYQRLKALPFASVTRVALDSGRGKIESSRPYFQFAADPQPAERLEELAEELAAGFRRSLSKRTLPILGRTALALSGGLDSRTLLCASPDREGLVSFCCYDEENEEFRTARAIAQSAGTEFVPLRRSDDFYADSALLGARISAGMGCIASNHFLGFRKELNELGVANLLTGCYCDYLFKGLALNRRVNRWTTRESVGRFDFAYYAKHFAAATPLGGAVRERLEVQFPAELRRYDTEACIAEIEHRRMFPLSYEEDNAARAIPQRVMRWYIPIAENDLMTTRLKMSSAMKLNRRVFSRTVAKVCGPSMTAINDSNTGQPVGVSWVREAYGSHVRRIKDRLRKLRASNATSGSWLNWSSYINKSGKVRDLWLTPNSDADDIFSQVLGPGQFRRDIRAYAGRQRAVFMQLFTLKLWLDQRAQ